MTGHDVLLAAFFVQADPHPPPLGEVVVDPHGQRRADAGEGVDHEADQCAVAGVVQGLTGTAGGVEVLQAVEQDAGFRGG